MANNMTIVSFIKILSRIFFLKIQMVLNKVRAVVVVVVVVVVDVINP